MTVEGIAEGNELHPVQEAFVEAGAVRGRLFDRVRKELGEGFDYLSVENGDIMSEGEVVLPLAEVLDEEIEETVEYRHRPTYPPDENAGRVTSTYSSLSPRTGRWWRWMSSWGSCGSLSWLRRRTSARR